MSMMMTTILHSSPWVTMPRLQGFTMIRANKPTS